VSRIQTRLVEGGMAAWAGQDAVPAGAVPGESGCALAAARVRDLLLEPGGDSVV